jgi:hypothetical protein
MERHVRGVVGCGAVVMLACAVGAAFPRAQAAAIYHERFIFAGDRGHVHASSVVETPNGSLLAVWYENGPKNPTYYFQGGDEDKSDDVRIAGARLARGSERWETPFVISDTFGVSDNNPALGLDPQKRLWLVHATLRGPRANVGQRASSVQGCNGLRGRRRAAMGANRHSGAEA